MLRQLDPSALALGAAGGMIAGLLVGWLIARAGAARPLAAAAARTSELETRLQERTAAGEILARERDAARTTAAGLHEELATVRAAQAGLAATVEAERAAAADKLAALQAAEQRLRDAFAGLSAEALRQNSQSFLELARTSMGEF